MSPARYSSVAVALHWAIALLIIGQIAGGFYMHNLPNDAVWKFALYQLHKSFGLSIFALSTARLVWRFTHRPPALPAAMPEWQKLAARGTHWAFYALMFMTPLAGWAMVSVSPLNVATEWFGMIAVPHLPFFAGVADASALEDIFKETHEYLAFAIIGLLALHVAAALKHRLIDRDGVFASMSPLRLGAAGGVVAIFAFLSVAAGLYLVDPAPPTSEEVRAVSHEHDHGDENLEGGEDGAVDIDASLAEQAPAAEDGDAAMEPAATIEPPTEEPHHDDDHHHDQDAAPAMDDASAEPPAWIVDYQRSALRFVGAERGKSFEGAFADFTADITFDPDDLGQSAVIVVVQTSTGATGGEFRDATMTDKEWFDTDDYPTATFASTEIRRTGEGAYAAEGVLAIKNYEKPITLEFTLDISGEVATARGGADLVRTDFGLGLASSWLDDEKIALDVRVEFDLIATKKP